MKYNERQFKPLKDKFDNWTELPGGLMPKAWYLELRNYIIFGLKPGSFHLACFENNLLLAAHKTDAHNQWEWIVAFMFFLERAAPTECWGSKENVEEWMNKSLQERFDICHKIGIVLTPEEVTWDVLSSEHNEITDGS